MTSGQWFEPKVKAYGHMSRSKVKESDPGVTLVVEDFVYIPRLPGYSQSGGGGVLTRVILV